MHKKLFITIALFIKCSVFFKITLSTWRTLVHTYLEDVGLPDTGNIDAGRDDPLIVVWVDTYWVCLEVKGVLTVLDMFQLVLVEVRPTPNPGVDHMWENLSAWKWGSRFNKGSRSTFIQCLYHPGKKKDLILPATCSLPSRVPRMVTHLVGVAPFVVMAEIRLSNSSRFFSFLTRDSIALLLNVSDSPV